MPLFQPRLRVFKADRYTDQHEPAGLLKHPNTDTRYYNSLRGAGSPVVVRVGDWVIYHGGVILAHFSDAEFNRRYEPYAGTIPPADAKGTDAKDDAKVA